MTTVLKTEGLNKVYQLGSFPRNITVRALNNVNLSIESDEPVIISIVGESGSGKTTLAKMILRLAEPTSGSRPGPTTINAMIRMMMSSGAPIPLMNGMCGEHLVREKALQTAGAKGVRVAQRGVRPTLARPPRDAPRGPLAHLSRGPRGRRGRCPARR